VLLGEAEGSSFPITHLLHLTNSLLKYFISNFCEACLLFDKVYFAIESLCINEVFDIFDEV
jgi:hypothetical protein